MVYPTSQLEIPSLWWTRGSLAERFLAHQEHVAVRTRNISSAEAAGLGGVGCTSVRFLYYRKLQKGNSILINGGSSGCGTKMVQIAKHLDGPKGKVVATCSTANIEIVKGLGADEVVDYFAHKPL